MPKQSVDLTARIPELTQHRHSAKWTADFNKFKMNPKKQETVEKEDKSQEPIVASNDNNAELKKRKFDDLEAKIVHMEATIQNEPILNSPLKVIGESPIRQESQNSNQNATKEKKLRTMRISNEGLRKVLFNQKIDNGETSINVSYLGERITLRENPDITGIFIALLNYNDQGYIRVIVKWTEPSETYFTIEKLRDLQAEVESGRYIITQQRSILFPYGQKQDSDNHTFSKPGVSNENAEENIITFTFETSNQPFVVLQVPGDRFASASNYLSVVSIIQNKRLSIDLRGKFQFVGYVAPTLAAITQGKLPIITSDIMCIAGYYEVAAVLQIPGMILACEYQFYKILTTRNAIDCYAILGRNINTRTLAIMCEKMIAYNMIKGNDLNEISLVPGLQAVTCQSLLETISKKELNYKGPYKFPVHPELKKSLDNESKKNSENRE
jgi:hypothetical protein